MKRGIVVVLDSFGVGAMDDVAVVRPQDLNANTARHLIEYPQKKEWKTLLQLGLMNALNEEIGTFKKNPEANFGTSNLMHYGADTFFGHQEIMGTQPKKPIKMAFQEVINTIKDDLIRHNYNVTVHHQNGLQLLSINDAMFIGDNMETDLGQAMNITGSLDLCRFDEIKDVGMIVRKHVKVPRVIAFGGRQVSFDQIKQAIITKDQYIGISAPASGVYLYDYHVVHIGYGVDASVQLPRILQQSQIKTYLYGKVADIVENPFGTSFSCVDTATCFEALIQDLKAKQEGFYCINIQETDLAGHSEDSERYIKHLNTSDLYLAKIIEEMTDEDILIVMADHGNDPTCGHSKHTRERVPILIHYGQYSNIQIGQRETLADVGATIAQYFNTSLAYGTSFMSYFKTS